VKFRPLDLLVPMHSSYKPLAVAVGVVGMYAMVFILVASWIRKGLPTKVWRATHIATVPTFTVAMLHGIFAGTDTTRPVMWGLYLATGLTILFLTIVRALTATSNKGWVVDRPDLVAGTKTSGRAALASSARAR
jgi:predicted ferric reductase